MKFCSYNKQIITNKIVFLYLKSFRKGLNTSIGKDAMLRIHRSASTWSLRLVTVFQLIETTCWSLAVEKVNFKNKNLISKEKTMI